jgi:hypothetical protein
MFDFLFWNTSKRFGFVLSISERLYFRFGIVDITNSNIPSLPGCSMVFMIFIWWKLKVSYHTVYPNPSWDGPSVVCYLFLYLFICAPTIAFTWLSTFCTLHLSSTFQGFIFEGGLQFSKLFKMTICKGMCTLKCTGKRLITFTPLHFLP